MPGLIANTTCTPDDVVERLIALMQALATAYPTVLGTIDLDGECEIDDESLPVLAGVAARGVVEREQNSTGKTTRLTRNYELLVLYARVEGKALEKQRAAVRVAQKYMDDIPVWLAQFPRLQLNDSGLRGVDIVGRAADENGVELYPWRDQEWAAVRHLLPVTTTI